MQKSVTVSSTLELKTFIKNLKKSKLIKLSAVYPHKKAIQFIPKTGGLYMFWWSGEIELLLKKIKTHKHVLKGKQTEEEMVNIKFNNDWINMATKGKKICLYIGKTTNLQQRITSHVKPETKDIWGNIGFESGRKPNTVSQMRSGIEKIFKEKEGLDIVLKNVSFCYLEINGVSNCVNRFYLEDLFVGTYFPLLNIDIER